MDYLVAITAIIIFAIVFISPVVLFMPLVVAIANRIAGKQGNAKEIQDLRNRVAKLEGEVSHVTTRLLLIEDTHHFDKKLVEDQIAKDTK